MNHPTRRRSDTQAGPGSPRDRLVTMLLLAALLHGIVILGVSFGPLAGSSSGDAGMEVLLVSDELPEARQNDSATYLSQRTQTGSGNTQERTAARIPGAAEAGGPAEAPRPVAAQAAEELLLSSTASNTRITYQTHSEPAPELPLLLGQGQAQASQSAAADPDLALRGPQRDELSVSADTRTSSLAPYLDSWKRRVERIGSLNFPSAAQRQGLKGDPVVEVVIGSDGRLQSAGIRRSSGHAEIDAAALEILRLASPFEPFPAELASEYKVLRFAYEWQFVGGKLARGSVSVP